MIIFIFIIVIITIIIIIVVVVIIIIIIIVVVVVIIVIIVIVVIIIIMIMIIIVIDPLHHQKQHQNPTGADRRLNRLLHNLQVYDRFIQTPIFFHFRSEANIHF